MGEKPLTIRKTLEEVAEVMLQNGASLPTIRNVLIAFGFPEDKVEEVTSALQSRVPSKNASTVNDQTPILNGSVIPLQEELKRQRAMIESLQEEIAKINLRFSQLSQEIKTLHGGLPQDVEVRLTSVEAKLRGFIEAVGDYIPMLMEHTKSAQ